MSGKRLRSFAYLATSTHFLHHSFFSDMSEELWDNVLVAGAQIGCCEYVRWVDGLMIDAAVTHTLASTATL